MKTNKGNLIAVVMIVLAVNLACAGLGVPATPTAVPTQTSIPTKIPTKTSAPVVPPAPPVSESKINLATTIQDHASGTFSFYPPVGWTVEGGDYDVYITEQKSGVFFYVSVTNTGYQLDADTYENFVKSTDDFYYASFDGYVLDDYSSSNAKDVILIDKSYEFEGRTQFVRSVYNQFGATSYTFEILGPESAIKGNSAYLTVFEDFIGSLEVDPDAANGLPIYGPTWNFVGPNEAMSIDVPLGWAYQFDDHETYSDALIETLQSPDLAALIENVSVVDGNSYTMGNAGQMALFLLNDRYSSGSNDIRVSDIKTLNDGSEFWTWRSVKGGFSGVTNFELRDGGRQILLLSFISDNDFLDLYQPLFDRVLSTYTIPK
ncbi:MAG: hypothetical protein JNM55_17410 [Anaerolineales bacterium]|nr:hypothetical protein [Anaerolineales bacterium]